MKTFLTTVSAIALIAGPALAQDTTMPKPAAPTVQENMVPAKTTGEFSADELINKSVKNAANESVGDINDLRIDSSGKVSAVIIGVGGFLGLGEKDVALPFDQLSITRDGDGGLVITADVTKESLQSAPGWKKPARS